MMNEREMRVLKRAIFDSIHDEEPLELLREWIPKLLPLRVYFDGTALGDLMDRWDPVSETIQDCMFCNAAMLDHVPSCPLYLPPDPDLEGYD